ncbi:MAG TPA: hypothetical protein VHL11_06280, partial [Phototrophicaceae bacterium]|nr:hypothetical protein [Phototrophicaceae bacterium]
MTATSQITDNRPPPRRRGTFNLFTPGIPWYRDVRILRIIAQLVFVVLFFGSLYILFSNLVKNLNASNLSLDFEVYKRPFNVAVSEGLSLTEPWTWTANTTQIGQGIWVVLIVLLLYFVYQAIQQYRESELKAQTVIIGVILAVL